MQSVNYFEAWSLWLQGQLRSDHILGGIQILWWGRIGKVIAFISALAIFVEIVGADRLRLWGGALHKPINVRQMVSGLRHVPTVIGHFWRMLRMAFLGRRERAEWHLSAMFQEEFFLSVLMLGVYLGLNIIALRYFFVSPGLWEYILLLVVVAPLNALTSVFVSVFSVVVARLLLSLIDIVLVEPFAWMLERPHLAKLMKLISVFLLFVGVHFDLLGD
jgi:hypothetical protein